MCGEKNIAVTTALMPEESPRMCGEKPTPLKLYAATTGSPPRVQGEELLKHAVDGFFRIIPAHAGIRAEQRPVEPDRKDHPPHVRGKVNPTFIQRVYVGITLACARKKRPDRPSLRSGWDHPCVCREK